MEKLTQFRLTNDFLCRLASKPADAKMLDVLQTGQFSKNLQLIHYLVEFSSEGESPLEQARQVLSQVKINAPLVERNLITAPFLGSWANYCARRTLDLIETILPMHVELSYLNATAVVGAMQAGLDADLDLYVRDRKIFLPTLGAVIVDAAEFSHVRARVRAGRAVLEIGREKIELPDGHHSVESAGWLPTRTVEDHAMPAPAVTIEDLDPYRDCYGKAVTGRMSIQEFERVAPLMRAACDLTAEHAPERAMELAGGLRSMVPLSPDEVRAGLSATSGTAFGALALTFPDKPEYLAATRIHEFQHSKLSALLDMVPLFDKEADARYFAAWKSEPRPIGGLIQGAYAFLAVAEFWCWLFEAGGFGSAPERHLARYRLQVKNVLNTLVETGHLNEDGKIFVNNMQGVLDRLLDVKVAPEADDEARRHLKETWEAWQRRNGEMASIG